MHWNSMRVTIVFKLHRKTWKHFSRRHNFTCDFFEERNEITPQIHIHKFEELTAWGQVSCWRSFLSSIGSSGLMRTLWMSEIIPCKTPILNPLVLQIFGCEFGEWFRSILQKSHLYQKIIFSYFFHFSYSFKSKSF